MLDESSSPLSPLLSCHPWVAEGQVGVRFGLAYAPYPDPDWPTCRDVVQLAEDLGYDSYWAMDHPMYAPDCWTRLAALAEVTRQIRLGSLVSCVFYRGPALLARIVADVDRMSDGRVVLGLGIGDFPHEFRWLGLPFPTTRERQAALAEAVQIVRGMWGETPMTFAGRYFQVQPARVPHPPVQQPRVPLLIAGGGEKVTLRQVARYADVANFGAHEFAGRAFTSADVRRKYDVLRQHCRDVGRDPDTILRSYWAQPVLVGPTRAAVERKLAAIPRNLRVGYWTSTVAGTPDEVIRFYRPIVEAGARYLIFGTLNGNDVETIRLLAEEVMPALAGL